MENAPPRMDGIECREVEIERRGGAALGAAIRADFRSASPDEERPCIVFCHGFLGHRRWGFVPYLMERLAAAGFHTLAVTFSRAGMDEETNRLVRLGEFASNTISIEMADLREVLRALRDGSLQVAARRIGLAGHSRGGAIAILVAPEFPEVASLATWATVGTLDRYSARSIEKWRRDGSLVFSDPRSSSPVRLDWAYYADIEANRERFDLPRARAELRVPHLLVHGERDAAVTLSEARRLLSLPGPAESRFAVIPGAGHTFGVRHPLRQPPRALERAIDLTVEWFHRTLIPTREESS